MPISILCCLSFGGLGLLPTLWRSSSCVVVLVFVFWRSGACAHPAADSLPLRGCGCLLSYGFLCGFCSWFVSSWWRSRGFCPPWGVFLLVVLAGVCCLVLWGFFLPWAVSVPFCGCVWSVFVSWRPGASACPGVFVFFPWLAVVCACLLVLWVSSGSGCFSSLWWLWLVLFLGALELLPALVCFSFPLFAVIGICPLVLVPCRFRLPCGAPGLALWLKSGWRWLTVWRVLADQGGCLRWYLYVQTPRFAHTLLDIQ